jgi:hypothetical protein
MLWVSQEGRRKKRETLADTDQRERRRGRLEY